MQHVAHRASDEIAELQGDLAVLTTALEKRNHENERLRAALNEIIELAHYPDATIAQKALGLPVTDRVACEQVALTAFDQSDP